MNALSEVSLLIGQRARDIEKAREIFTSEIRGFAAAVLTSVRRFRSDPWTTARVRVDLPKEIEYEAKATSDFSSQFALARVSLRFKKGIKFLQIAEVRFGVEFDEDSDAFAWQLMLVPESKYNRIDDVVWHKWRSQQNLPPGPKHFEKANSVRFLCRPLGADLTTEVAFNDTKTVLEFLMTTEGQLADAVGLDASDD